MKMTLTDAFLHQVKTRPRSAAFIFHSRRGLPRSPMDSLRIARSKDRNVLRPWQLRLIRPTVSTSELRLCSRSSSRPGRVGLR
jgi:hypothetical protein